MHFGTEYIVTCVLQHLHTYVKVLYLNIRSTGTCIWTDCESCPIQCFRWVGVGDATGDYPFSHHKLTVQFSEASAAQDRKLEGLVHKAIRELWRPNPSQLTLLQTKGIGALHKEHPKACTLTGSSDPCYIEAYHLADPTDGRITLHLKVWPD